MPERAYSARSLHACTVSRASAAPSLCTRHPVHEQACMGPGYMYGEAVDALGWRACFWIEAAFGLPVALLFLFAPAIDLRGEGTELPGALCRTTKS